MLETISDGAQKSVLVRSTSCNSNEGNYLRLHKIRHWNFFNVPFLLFSLSIICLCTSLYSWTGLMLEESIRQFIGPLFPTDTWSIAAQECRRACVCRLLSAHSSASRHRSHCGSCFRLTPEPVFAKQDLAFLRFLVFLYYGVRLFWSLINNI